jgi:hypothetical protein
VNLYGFVGNRGDGWIDVLGGNPFKTYQDAQNNYTESLDAILDGRAEELTGRDPSQDAKLVAFATASPIVQTADIVTQAGIPDPTDILQIGAWYGLTKLWAKLADWWQRGRAATCLGKRVDGSVDSAFDDDFNLTNTTNHLPLSRQLNSVVSSGANLVSTPGKVTTILGRYYPDMEGVVREVTGGIKSWSLDGEIGGFNVLNIPDGVYQLRGANGFWTGFNQPFLDAAIRRADVIILATEPSPGNLRNSFGQLTGFGQEFEYLLRSGYTFSPETKRMERTR